MAYLSAVDQEPWRIVAEDASQGYPRLSSMSSGHQDARSCGRERVKRYFKKETSESYINVITYFHEIIRIHMSVETYTYHQYNIPYRTLMNGWRKTRG